MPTAYMDWSRDLSKNIGKGMIPLCPPTQFVVVIRVNA